MPLSGGAADKYGNRYEGRWTVNCMLDILAGKATSIRLEPVGDEGAGVEFSLHKGDITQYHQVKRQNSGGGRWSLVDLQSKQVLRDFLPRIRQADKFCTFVSSHSMYQIHELFDRSNRSASYHEFMNQFLDSKIWNKAFDVLCDIWKCDQIEAYNYLKKITIVTVDESTLQNMIYQRAENTAHGNGYNLIDILAQFALDSVHQRLSFNDIWRHLESRGFKRIVNLRDQDIHIIRFFRRCFDRAAFKDSFSREGSGADMRQAIEDTILAINTGQHFDRRNREMRNGYEKGQLSNNDWYEAMDEIVAILEQINRRYQQAIDAERIIVRRLPKGRESRDIRDGELADWIDGSRNKVIEKFSKICVEAGIRPLKPLRGNDFIGF
jgi:hypothetical protein